MQLVRQVVVAGGGGIDGARKGGLQRLEVHIRHALRVAAFQFPAKKSRANSVTNSKLSDQSKIA